MNIEEAKKLKEASDKISAGEEKGILAGIRLMARSHLTEGADLIGPLMKHPSKKVKMAVMTALGDIQTPEAVHYLAEFLNHEPDQHLRAQAATSLGRTQQRKAIVVLANLLKDTNARVRANAVEALADIGEPDSVALLTPLLDDPNNRVKANVAMTLWKFGGLRMVGVLKSMLRGHGDKWHRASAAYALGEIGGIHTIASLLEALEDNAPEVRRNVIRSLGKTGDAEANRQLSSFLEDDDPQIRGNALEALSTIEDEKNLDFILGKLRDETDSHVLSKAKICLEKMADKGSMDIMARLKKVLYSEKLPLKKLVIEVLGQHGTGDVLPDLLNIARSGLDSTIREAASKAAEAIKSRKE